jgi:hypothetical protein
MTLIKFKRTAIGLLNHAFNEKKNKAVQAGLMMPRILKELTHQLRGGPLRVKTKIRNFLSPER